MERRSSSARERASLASMALLVFLAAATPTGLVPSHFTGRWSGHRHRFSRSFDGRPVRFASLRRENGFLLDDRLGREPEEAHDGVVADRVLKVLEKLEALFLERHQRILLAVGHESDALTEILYGGEMLPLQEIERLENDPTNDL